MFPFKRHTYTHVETSHGLTTTRTLTASTLLTDYIKWPIAQVYQYQFSEKTQKQPRSPPDAVFTSLSPEVASAEDLLKLRREHWDRKQSPLGPRHRSRGGRFTGENRSQHYATTFYASQDTQKSLKQYDFSSLFMGEQTT